MILEDEAKTQPGTADIIIEKPTALEQDISRQLLLKYRDSVGPRGLQQEGYREPGVH